ncbi:MAG: glutamate-1-semialdehyde 2,1-aminomutase [Armatimonadetes bacterium]|nr:glutamate-1-semialdehyde 2,1-aminomutase [Armatimonadota bacterium]
MPGGVSSPVRAFRAVGGTPVVIAAGAGARVTDIDGREYWDYVQAWGPLIVGHAHPEVVRAVTNAARQGLGFGAPTPAEVELARLIVEALPSVARVRFVTSGTEAVMSALRLARAVTGRPLIVKFDGCYHGHADALLARAGSGLLTLGLPASPGVPAEVAALTVTLPFNDAESVRALFEARGEAAAVAIVEPVAGNMGVVPPAPGFLEELRERTSATASLLIFDEVITGFRLGWSGAQGRYGITPDLTCLGKIIGGGLPAAAYGGRADLMAQVAPEGPVYQAGTLSGHPLAMRAGAETLRLLRRPGAYERLEALGAALEAGLRDAAARRGLPLTINRVGSMLTPFFSPGPITDSPSAQRADTRAYARFFHEMLARGVLIPPSQFEAWFLSLAHDEVAVEETVRAADAALAQV